MPSPPLVPTETAIDRQHLERMTLGDPGLEAEVLVLFAGQSRDLAARLAAGPSDAATLVHTLKGSARSIGAFRVADAAQELEATLRKGVDPSADLAELSDAVEEAAAEIDRMLDRS